jgi:hypothetical protein
MKRATLAVLFALSGCLVPTTESEGVEQEPGRAESTATTAPPRKQAREAQAPQCAESGSVCSVDTDCCAGSFCFNFTYLPPVCRSLIADGEWCEEDGHCQSGHCVDYVCRPAVCASVGTTCLSDDDCCANAFCLNYTYAPPVCTAAQQAGAVCHEDRQCASGACTSFRCAP